MHHCVMAHVGIVKVTCCTFKKIKFTCDRSRQSLEFLRLDSKSNLAKYRIFSKYSDMYTHIAYYFLFVSFMSSTNIRMPGVFHHLVKLSNILLPNSPVVIRHVQKSHQRIFNLEIQLDTIGVVYKPGPDSQKKS